MTDQQKKAAEESKESYWERYDGAAAIDFEAGLQEVLNNPENYGLIPIEQHTALLEDQGTNLSERISIAVGEVESELEANLESVSLERDRLRSALSLLVQLKHTKDESGKTLEYVKLRPIAWDNAKQALKGVDTCK